MYQSSHTDKDRILNTETANGSSRDMPTSVILFLGDVGLARRIGEGIDKRGSSYPLANLPDNFFNVDAVVFNLECCLSSRGTPWEPKPELMRGSPRYLDIFPRRNQVYVANLANNHILDYGEVGALDTINALESRGMSHMGLEGSAVRQEPTILTTKGGSIALLAFSSAAHRLPGARKVNVSDSHARHVLHKVREAQNLAEVVVVSLHQGVEYSQYTDRASRKLARAIIDAGADCVVCHHSHVVQAIEQFREGIIFHGIGNFLLDIHPDRRPAAGRTLALRMELCRGRIASVQIEPLGLNEEWQPYPLDEVARSELFTQVDDLSSLFKSRIGAMRNDLVALMKLWELNYKAFVSMVRRAGAIRTITYYLERVPKKLGIKY